jgi:hypothetical protein
VQEITRNSGKGWENETKTDCRVVGCEQGSWYSQVILHVEMAVVGAVDSQSASYRPTVAVTCEV